MKLLGHDLSLIAILRGVTPAEVVDVGDALHEAGFRCIEVPLNSPQPFDSIARLRAHFAERAVIGAGTVLSTAAVDAVVDAGGQMIISPNVDVAVIAHAKSRGLVSLPGYFTATEAFAALGAGADGLKLFPAEIAGIGGLKAIKAVLPPEVAVYAVGGVDPGNAAQWRAAGAAGLGLGSALFKPGMSAAEVADRAAAFVQAWSSPS
jgi:2-dehydro-3-deoxyphosphogalactonate aldolase